MSCSRSETFARQDQRSGQRSRIAQPVAPPRPSKDERPRMNGSGVTRSIIDRAVNRDPFCAAFTFRRQDGTFRQFVPRPCS